MRGIFILTTAAVVGLAGIAKADTVVVTADRMLDVVAGRTVERPQITITDGTNKRHRHRRVPRLHRVRAGSTCRARRCCRA